MTTLVSSKLVALVMLVGCGACAPYLDRSDTLTEGSGEAVQANIAIHVIDPWPAAASRIDRQTNGERVQRAMERYRNPQTGAAAPGLGAPATQQGSSVSATPAGIR